MAISYLVSLEQLSVLAHFSGIDSFPRLAELPTLNRERSTELLETLSEQGMIHLLKAKTDKAESKAAVDMTLAFVLSIMAKPALVMQTAEGVLGYCSDVLGVVVTQDARNKSKYRITPMPDAKELAERLWDVCVKTDGLTVDFMLYFENGEYKNVRLTKAELEATISKIYTNT
jgi:hypothetical protein